MKFKRKKRVDGVRLFSVEFTYRAKLQNPVGSRDKSHRKMTPPKAAATSMSISKKWHDQHTMMPLVEETWEAFSSASRFPKDYILPRKPSAKQINL